MDGQVPADQVLFQGDIGAGVEREPAITASAFAFGSGQGVFLATGWMKKNWKVRPDRAKPLGEHVFGAGTHYHPVDIGNRLTQQAIADRAADFINLHEKPPLARQDNP